MHALKSFWCLLLTAALLISVGIGAEATAPNESSTAFKDNSDFIQDYIPIENGLKIHCAAMEEMPTEDAFQVKLGNKAAKIAKLETAKSEPVTYYCLVDVSGSLTSMQMLCAKQMLHALCNSLGSEDQMVVATVGNEVRTSDYLSDPEKIHAKIDEIITTNEDTNLYRAITDSLEELDTAKDVTDRKCLVVFSDGDDDSTAEIGRTQQEAERKISETRIPVYCMFPPSDKKDAGKVLSSFARSSAGGEAFFLAERKLTEAQIGQAIAADMKGDLILTLDLDGFIPQKDEILLTISYTDKKGISYGDSINIISSNLILVTPPPTASPPSTASPSSNSVTPTPGPTDPPQPLDPLPKWLIPAIIGGGLVLILLIILLVRNKQKKEAEERKRREEELRRKEEEKKRKEKEQKQQRGGDSVIDGDDAGEGTIGSSGPGGTDGVTEPIGRHVRFTTVGNQSFAIDLYLQEGRKLILGRNGKADVILNKDDSKLSGAHFGLLLENDTIRIWDAGSTNGTSVNGVPLIGNSVQIHSGETVTAGNYQYRIQF